MKRGIAVAAVIAATCPSACSTDDGDSTTADLESTSAPSSEATTSSAPTVAPQLTMQEACSQVEATLPHDPLPTADQLARFVTALEGIQAQGDLETQNAIPLILEPTRVMYQAEASGESGSAYIDASTAWLDGISAFAKRCKAAGSSALQ